MTVSTRIPASCSDDARARYQLAGLCIAGLAMRLAAYYWRPGIVAPDEVFQYLEQAHRLVFQTGLVPWEYVLGMRNWLIPGAIAAVMEVARAWSDGPAVQVGAVALCMSVLSLSTVVCGFRWGCNIGGLAAGLITGGLNCFWFEQIYYAAHPLADTVAGAVLMPALYLACPGAGTPPARRLFWAGVLFGLTLAVRIQLGPAIAMAGLWCIWPDIKGRLRPLIVGGILPLCLLGVVDTFTWGAPFRSLWLYVRLNADISAGFGTTPFYALVAQALANLSFFAGFAAVFAVFGARRLPLVGMTAAVIVATFSLFAHKEPRFLYPAVPLLLTLTGIGSAEFGNRIAERLKLRMSRQALGVAGLAVWLMVSTYLGFFGPFRPFWSAGTGTVAAFRVITADPDACGVAVEPALQWPDSGGYVLLRPGIPLVSLVQGGFGAPGSRYNYIFTYKDPGGDETYRGPAPAGVTADRVDCWDEHDARGYDAKVCLYHIRQGCIHGHSESLVAVTPPFLARAMTWAAGN